MKGATNRRKVSPPQISTSKGFFGIVLEDTLEINEKYDGDV